MIQLAVSLLAALAGLTSGRAAWLWYLASQVDAPRTLEGFSVWTSRAEQNQPNVKIDATPLIEFAQEDGTRLRRCGTQRLRPSDSSRGCWGRMWHGARPPVDERP